MNGFRLTILILLCLVVGMMAYVMFGVLPSREADYRLYNISQRNAQFERQDAAHQERLNRYTNVEDQNVAQAQSETEESDRQAEAAINEAEERLIIEEAKRKEEAALAQQAQNEANAPQTLGHVVNYDPDWNSIRFAPSSQDPMTEGLVIALRRNGLIVAEAVVDFIDTESGQVGATMKNSSFSSADGVQISQDKLTPQLGDEVIVTPFASARDLRSNTSLLPPTLSTTPASLPVSAPVAPSSSYPNLPQDDQDGLPDIDASFAPLP